MINQGGYDKPGLVTQYVVIQNVTSYRKSKVKKLKLKKFQIEKTEQSPSPHKTINTRINTWHSCAIKMSSSSMNLTRRKHLNVNSSCANNPPEHKGQYEYICIQRINKLFY